MKMTTWLAPLCLCLAATPAAAAEISTHILDLAKGVGRQNVPVTLSRHDASGGWTPVGSARTDTNGRVRRFEVQSGLDTGIYQLRFDMAGYPSAAAAPFFPEITVTFHVTDAAGHYHVPVVVSPFGYSTYRGN